LWAAVPGTILLHFWVLLSVFISITAIPFKMTEKEDSVYKAKLAEQAERYDGTMCGIILFSIIPNDTDTCLCVIYRG